MRVTSAAVFVLLVSVFAAAPSTAQAPPQAPPGQAPPSGQATPGRLRVYLDCNDCFQDYLRDEISWADFVRQPQDADVHLLSNSQTTGGGGREVVLRFVGVGRFDNVNHELRALSEAAETENVRRANVLRTVTVGLLHYMAREGLPAGLDVDVEADQLRPAAARPVRDPWNQWFFRVGSGGSMDAEESQRQARWDFNLSADRVTDNWKISFGSNMEREHETFDLDEDEPFEVERHETRFDWFFAKSLGPHWSLGFEGEIESSSFGNTKLSAATGPAIEFSIFPYQEYATRQFVLQYRAGAQHSEYNEITLFGKLGELRGLHELSARLDQRQPWGSAESSVEFSQYFHDPSKYRLEVNGEVSIRITRGLSVNFDGSASRVRDQLSLPRRDATSEEVLLELRELQSGYELSFSAGVSYSFGSLFNNVVNPRFGN